MEGFCQETAPHLRISFWEGQQQRRGGLRKIAYNRVVRYVCSAGPPGRQFAPSKWCPSSSETGSLELQWRMLAGALPELGGSLKLFLALHGEDCLDDTFWLDRSAPLKHPWHSGQMTTSLFNCIFVLEIQVQIVTSGCFSWRCAALIA